LALATGTTAIGLLSMCITNLVPIRMFGLYSAIGVVISFFVVCLYVPSLLNFFPLRNIDRPAERRIPDPGLSPKWRHVGEFVIRRSGWLVVACLALMAVGAYGVSKSTTSVKLMRLFSPDARIIHDYAWLEKRLGPLVPMEVVVRVDRTKCELDAVDQMALVSQVQQAMMTLDDVGSTQAAPTFARQLPVRPSVIERQAWKTQLARHRDDLREYLCSDGNEELWRVSARVAALTNLDYGDFAGQIREVVEPVLDAYRQKGYEGISATYTGLVPLIYQAQSSMLDGLLLNFVGDLILIGIAIILLLRSFSAGLLLALPSLFPLAIVFGGMGFMGIVIDVGTVMVPAVALGVTVDDAIHFMLWCRHGEERGMTKKQAIMFAYGDCARAIYQSWGVIGLGLFSFALSSFTPTQRFGYLMFTMLTASSIGNLVMLPALLASPAGRFFWLSDKGRKSKGPASRAPVPKPHLQPAREPSEETEGLVIPMGNASAGAVPHCRPAAERPAAAVGTAGRSPDPGSNALPDAGGPVGAVFPGTRGSRGHVIETRGLNKWYGSGELRVHVLRGINLSVKKGEFVAIMGPSGSGKSTLLHMLGAVDVPSGGEVRFEGHDLATLDDDQRTLIRRNSMGFIFQSFNLLPAFSAEENVALPLELGNLPAAEARQRAVEMLKVVGVEHRRLHIPSALSGGEQQRVAIARALVTNPVLLLADEPTGNLDSTNGHQVTALLRRLVDEHQQTIVMVTHDAQVAGHADRLVVLRDGLIENEIKQGQGKLRTRGYSYMSR
jgi:ABC-type lipoprotein export system ATPase subunit